MQTVVTARKKKCQFIFLAAILPGPNKVNIDL